MEKMKDLSGWVEKIKTPENITNEISNVKTKIEWILNLEYDESKHLQTEEALAKEFWLDTDRIEKLKQDFKQPLSVSDWIFDSDEEEHLFAA